MVLEGLRPEKGQLLASILFKYFNAYKDFLVYYLKLLVLKGDLSVVLCLRNIS